MKKFKVLIVEDDSVEREGLRNSIEEICGKSNVDIKDDWKLLKKEAKDQGYEFDLIVLDLGVEFDFDPENRRRYFWKDEDERERPLGGLYVAEKLIEKKHCKHIYVETSYLESSKQTIEPQKILEKLIDQGRVKIWEKSNKDRDQHFITMVSGAYWAFKKKLRINARDVSKIYHAALSNEPLLLLGKTGTGKGMFANLLNELHRSKDESADQMCFADISCAGLEGNFLKAELFGYIRDVYTGANAHKLGAVFTALGLKVNEFSQVTDKDPQESFRRGLCTLLGLNPGSKECTGQKSSRFGKNFIIENRGVLFLDEIGYLGPLDQGQLLQLIDRKIFYVWGYSGIISVPNLKIVAATSNDKWRNLATNKDSLENDNGLTKDQEPKLDLFERFGLGNTIIMGDLTQEEVFEELNTQIEPEWENEAINYVGARWGNIRGQKRGLRKIIDAAKSYVDLGPSVGIPNDGKVTKEIVELIMNPANVSGVMNSSPSVGSISSIEEEGIKASVNKVSKRRWNKEDYLNPEDGFGFKEDSFEYAVVCFLFEKKESSIGGTKQEIINLSKSHPKKPINIEKNILQILSKVSSKFNNHKRKSGLFIKASGNVRRILDYNQS